MVVEKVDRPQWVPISGEPLWDERQLYRLAPQAVPVQAGGGAELTKLRAVAQAYVDMIHGVEQRCMAADGPVTPTHKEITDAELRAVYVLATAALK